MSQPTITAQTTLAEVMAALPGARRALFAKYHIGGCNRCAFQPEETLSALCERNESIPVQEMIDHLVSAHAVDESMMISPAEAKLALDSQQAKAIDIRLREEHDAVHIPGSLFKTQDLMTEIFSTWPKDTQIIIYDHKGTGAALDAAAYFVGHEFNNAKALRGGIDAYSVEADASIGRYQIEFE